MTLIQLRYFVHICSLGSFTRASEQLHVAQSALSRQIALLEDELGTPLLIRQGHRLDLTRQGTQLLEHARRVLDGVEELRKAVGPRCTPEDLIRIGYNPSLSDTLVIPAMIETRKKHPETRFQLSERLSQELTRALMEDQLDVALMSAPAPDPGLVVIPLFWEYMWVLSAPGRARVGGVVHSLESIRELPLVQTTADSLPRRFLQDKSVQDRVPLNVRVECDSLTSIKELVSKGDLAHISPQSAFIEELREGRVEGTPIPGLRLVRAAVRRADRPPGAATAAFLKNISRRVQAVMPRKQLLLAGSKAADAPP